MAGNPNRSKGFSLRRWSQRKLDAERAAGRPEHPRADAAILPAMPRPNADPVEQASSRRVSPAPLEPADTSSGAPARAPAGRSERTSIKEILPPLPSLDSLTIDSDYSGFMQAGVDDSLKRGALKKLFSDPRFNVMDGLDVYIDDYSKPDPIDPAVVRTLAQARYIFNPPPTRVTAEGYVEDIPEEELQALKNETPAVEASAPPGEVAADDGVAQRVASSNAPATAADAAVRPSPIASADAVALPAATPPPDTERESK